jgi:CRISPR-associated protein Cmr4
MFSHYVRTQTVVDAHVTINDETGAAEKNKLFFVESIPSETILIGSLFYSKPVNNDKMKDAHDVAEKVRRLITVSPFFVGGDVTVGRGLISTKPNGKSL